jgi:hypothetical protein
LSQATTVCGSTPGPSGHTPSAPSQSSRPAHRWDVGRGQPAHAKSRRCPHVCRRRRRNGQRDGHRNRFILMTFPLPRAAPSPALMGSAPMRRPRRGIPADRSFDGSLRSSHSASNFLSVVCTLAPATYGANFCSRCLLEPPDRSSRFQQWPGGDTVCDTSDLLRIVEAGVMSGLGGSAATPPEWDRRATRSRQVR